MKSHLRRPTLLFVSILMLLPLGSPSLWAAEPDDVASESEESPGPRGPRIAKSGPGIGMSQGVDRLLSEIDLRRKALKESEREVARREAAVDELEALIVERVAMLEESRLEIEARIERWEQKDGDRIKKLSKVYSAMAPPKAAGLLSRLELDLSVAILSGMKQKNSALVLSAIPRDRALDMSRRMVRPLGAGPPAAKAK